MRSNPIATTALRFSIIITPVIPEILHRIIGNPLTPERQGTTENQMPEQHITIRLSICPAFHKPVDSRVRGNDDYWLNLRYLKTGSPLKPILAGATRRSPESGDEWLRWGWASHSCW